MIDGKGTGSMKDLTLESEEFKRVLQNSS